MEIEAVKKLIREYMPGHMAFALKADAAERYYLNKTDILFRESREGRRERGADEADNPLRNADNRIPHNFHGMLVNQKAAYMFTYPPIFDVGSPEANERVKKALGTKFRKALKTLCINASNAGAAWLHYWKGADGGLHYAVIDSRQVIPIWTDDQERKLKGVMRAYDKILDDGKKYAIYEIWNEECCESFAREAEGAADMLMPYSVLEKSVAGTGGADAYRHGWGRVPFICFANNDMQTGDLENIKGLIDTYDKVYSGFVDDLEDIQEVVFILSGYGGADLAEFMKDLKKYKAVKIDADEAAGEGLKTLAIDIPVEAREKLLAMTRREIFEQGQGVDPQPENYGNASGEALKFMYTLLELKAGLMEVEFQLALEEFVKAVCAHLGIACDEVQQTWTRNMIRNDRELAEMCSAGAGVISQRTIVKNHPFVEDPEEELKQIEAERQQAMEKEAELMYGGAFGGQQGDDGGQQDGGGRQQDGGKGQDEDGRGE